MIKALITSKTRVKLLMKFFLNSRNTSYLRDLASEFGESTNAIRPEETEKYLGIYPEALLLWQA